MKIYNVVACRGFHPHFLMSFRSHKEADEFIKKQDAPNDLYILPSNLKTKYDLSKVFGNNQHYNVLLPHSPMHFAFADPNSSFEVIRLCKDPARSEHLNMTISADQGKIALNRDSAEELICVLESYIDSLNG